MFYAFSLKKGLKIFSYLICILLLFMSAVIVFFHVYPVKHIEMVRQYADKYRLEPEFVMAVIKAESGFDEDAVSRKGARGLMQIMQPTGDWAAERIGIDNYSFERINEPEINIEIGCWYLNRLMAEQNGDINRVVAAYNAGSGNVAKWINDERYSKTGESLDRIPFKETSRYVEKVNKNKRIYEYIFKILGGMGII